MWIRVNERKELKMILELQYTAGFDNMLLNLRNWAMRVGHNHRLSEEHLKRAYKRFVDKYYNQKISYNTVNILRGMDIKNCSEVQFLALVIYGLNVTSTGQGMCYYVFPPQYDVPMILRTRIITTQDKCVAVEFSLEAQPNLINQVKG